MEKTEKSKPKPDVGRIGEIIVSKYLEGKGFEIIGRNFRKKWGEIDVIGKRGETIHFVEVKTVSRKSATAEDAENYAPEENVHPEKLRRLSRAIQSYLLENKIPEETPWQIDVAGVFLDVSGKKARVRMTENVVI